MMNSDKSTRKVSVPFESYSNGYFWVIPGNMNITELYLHIKLVAPDAQSLSFKLMIGGFIDVGGDTYSPASGYTDNEVNTSHRTIKGDDNNFTCSAGETLLIDGLSLLRAFNNSSDTNPDAFNLLFYWDEEPDFELTGSILTRINGSALLGVK